jgi:hypothetical protein
MTRSIAGTVYFDRPPRTIQIEGIDVDGAGAELGAERRSSRACRWWSCRA